MLSKIRSKLTPLYFLFVALLLASQLAACNDTGQGDEPVVEQTPATPEPTPSGRGLGGTLRLLNPQAPETLNPHLATAVKDREAARMAYEPLASFSASGELVPFLAAEIPSQENGGVSEDFTTVIWKLKPGIFWSDGTPMTAADILFTYNYVTNPDVNAASKNIYNTLTNVEVVDDLTIKLTFNQPALFPAWASPFVGVQGVIIPEHIFADYIGANAAEAPGNKLPVGTGAYRVVSPGLIDQEVLLLGSELVKTTKVVFEPNPYFRDPDKPFFSRVELRGGAHPPEAARLVLETGTVDYAYQLDRVLPADLEAILTQTSPGELIQNPVARAERLLLNRTDPNRETESGEKSSLQFPHPFLSDLMVRQAIAHAINRDAIAALYGESGLPTYNNLVAPPQFSSTTSDFYPYNLEEAIRLLNEAGWQDSNGNGIRDKWLDSNNDGVQSDEEIVEMRMVFSAQEGEVLQQSQRIIADDLAKIGIAVETKSVDPSNFLSAGTAHPDAVTRFNADLIEFSIRSNSPDPTSYMRYWTCSNIPQEENNWRARNVERACLPEYDALLQQVGTETDLDVRASLFIALNDMLVKDVVMVPIVWRLEAQAKSKSLFCVDLTPWDANTWKIMDWSGDPDDC